MRKVTIEGDVLKKVCTALSRSPLFSQLPTEHINQVAQRAALSQFEDGERVVEEGTPSESFFVILSGELTVFIRGENGEAIDVGRLHSPDSIGEMGLLLNEPRTASVVASGAGALLLEFTAEAFKMMYERIPGFGVVIAQHLARLLKQVSRRIPLPENDPTLEPDPAALTILPADFQLRHRVVPLRTEGNILVVGFVDDPSPQVVSNVRALVPGMELDSVRVSLEWFNQIMGRLSGVAGAFSEGIELNTPAQGDLELVSGSEMLMEQQQSGASSANLDPLLRRMVAEGASDLHLSGGQQPRWRIDGEMLPISDLPRLGSTDVIELFDPVMEDRSRDEFEATGDVDFAYAIPGVARFRVNLFRDRGGAGAVLRVIPTNVLTMEQLNLPEVCRTICDQPKGLVLVTGPTGSGKSTTLAAMIDYINKSRKRHIITLEDPIEFVHQSLGCLINQREVGSHTGSFSRALKAALREDPDIVLVGEMRDLETVSLALETANTGHLVFGTLHTATAISTIDRIVDLFPADQQNQVRTVVADTLKGVISQTLLRRNGGGRVAALEVLVGSFAISNLIREGKNHQIASAMSTGRAQGNRMLNDELAKLVLDGSVTYEEALSKAADKADFTKRCGNKVPRTAQHDIM